jgi:hypothetical protein
MSIEKRVRLVQAFTGALVLTLLMIPMGIAGYGQHTWMLFLPMLLFFALGADFKKIPSMIICYILGVGWGFLPGFVGNFLGSVGAPGLVVQNLPPILIIFLILTVHENFLRTTPLGNIPALFLGMASAFYVFYIQPGINPLHLIVFYIYGIVLSVCLVISGVLVSGLIFGKETVQKVLSGQVAGK